MLHLKPMIMAAFCIASLAITAPAQAVDSLEAAFAEGTPYIDMRYRYEFVDQEGLPDHAHASTLRTRLGYRSGSFYDFSGVLEFENVTQLGADNYNDTLNGRATHPIVADIETNEVNQAYVQYEGIADTRLRLGREMLTIDNHRFIGNVGWRQNNQTYDTVNLVNRSLDHTVVTYAYLENVNRIFGEDSPAGDWDTNSHLLNVSYDALPIGKLTGYGYFLDIEDAPTLSSKTYGASLDGVQELGGEWKLKYRAEYAYQQEHADNPINYEASYYHFAPALMWKGLTATAGYERLGSDNGVIGFSTPFATLHKFNGWADRFLTTPGNGLEDRYIDLTYDFDVCGCDEIGGLMLKAQYHDFSAVEGGADYGTEFDFYAKKDITKHYYVEAKYADYNAESFSVDTQKFILGIGVLY